MENNKKGVIFISRKAKTKIKKGVVFPIKKKRILAIIQKNNKSAVWTYVRLRYDSFRVDGNTYFIMPEGIYMSVNNVLYSLYFEGISQPLTHKNIDTKQETRTYKDEYGTEQTTEVTLIDGLNYDSELIDMILNRKIVDEFTKTHFDLPNLIVIILLLVTVGVGIANLGVTLS